MWKWVAGSLAFGALSYSVIKYFAGGVCRCKTRLDGLVVIVTGANSGIGKALCIELYKRGAILVLACRDLDKANTFKDELLTYSQNKFTDIYIRKLDLACFESIIEFVNSVRLEFKEIYALVNNAGVFYHPQELTVDKFDVTFQTNYLGPFVLTHLLLNELKAAAHSRIIFVGSEAHRYVNVYDLRALTRSQTEFRTHITAYGVSKLAVLLLTKELAKKLQKSNVIVNTVNPGNVETAIYRNFPLLSNPWLYALQWPIRLVVVKSPRQGAQTVLHALLTSNRSSGGYYSDCRLILPSPLVLQDQIVKELYNLTLELISDKFTTESEC